MWRRERRDLSWGRVGFALDGSSLCLSFPLVIRGLSFLVSFLSMDGAVDKRRAIRGDMQVIKVVKGVCVEGQER